MTDARAIYGAHPIREEIDDLLGQRLPAAVGTLNEDGSIHLAYVLFLHEEGCLYLETSSLTRKARNVAARSTATLLVDGQASTGRRLMVAVEGTGRIVTGADAQGINRRLRAKYIEDAALESIDRAWGSLDDVAIEVAPERWRSWTNELFRAETERYVDGSYGDIWRE